MKNIISFLCLFATIHIAYAHPSKSDTVFAALQKMQNPSNKLWKRCGWWNSGNNVEAICDYYALNGKCDTALLRKIYKRNKFSFHSYRNNFINVAFDDNAWWALSWLKAYELTGNQKYYKVAVVIWKDMADHAWSDACGGGVQWRRPTPYKNAITNELFLLLSGRLAALEKNEQLRKNYLDWTNKEWNWLKNSGMMNSEFLFNDGVDSKCNNNKQTTWTYNQGVILGGLTQLYQLSNDTNYLLLAQKIAVSAINQLTDSNGILVEPCMDNCGADGVQFKAAFVRHLAPLAQLTRNQVLLTFIQRNVQSVWKHSHNDKFFFDARWDKPYKNWSGAAQGVVLDLMNAEMRISSRIK